MARDTRDPSGQSPNAHVKNIEPMHPHMKGMFVGSERKLDPNSRYANR